MKKTLFSKGIYKETLRRLRVVGFIALAFLLVFQLAPIIIQLVDYITYLEDPTNYYGDGISSLPKYTPETVNFSMVTMTMPVTAVMIAPIMVLIAFSVFNKRASSDFYHSLPYTRPCVFVSMTAAVYTWVISISVLCSLVGYVGMASLPKLFTVVYDGAFDLILTYVAQAIMTVGACALGMALTGNLLSNVCVTGLILFLPRFIITVMTSWISSTAGFLAIDASGTSFLSMNINVLVSSFVGSLFYGTVDFSNNLPADIYSICLGLVYTALALFTFVKRKSETATQPAPDRITQHIIRILLSMVIGIFAVMLLLEAEIAGAIIVSLVTVALYFSYELITTKKWKNCVRALPGLGVLAALCIICGVVMVSVPKVASGYTPDADDVDSVRIVSNGANFYRDQWFGLEAQNLDLEGEEIVKLACTTLKENIELYKKHGNMFTAYMGEDMKGDYELYNLTVAFKKGLSTKYRTLYMLGERYTELINALNTNEEYTEACKKLPKAAIDSVTFGYWQAEEKMSIEYKKDILECLQEEVNALPFEEWYVIATNGYTYGEEFAVDYTTQSFNNTYVRIPVSSDLFPKTFEMIANTKHIDKNTVLADLGILLDKNTVESAMDGEAYINIDVRLKDTDEKGNSKECTAYLYVDGQIDKTVVGKNDYVYYEALCDMLTKLKATKNEPTSGKYIYVNYYYSSYSDYADKEGMHGDYYLPLPDNFDYEKWDFKQTSYDDTEGDNTVETYVAYYHD